MTEPVTLSLNDQQLLEVKVGSKRYVNSPEGLRKWVPESATEKGALLEGLERRTAYEGMLMHVRDNAAGLTDEVKEALPRVFESLPESEAVIHPGLRQQVVEMVEGAHGLTPTSSAEAITDFAKAHPKGLDLLTKDKLEEIKTAGHDLDGIRREAASLASKAEALAKVQLELGKVKNNSQMIEFLKKNGLQLRDLELTAEQKALPIVKRLEAVAVEATPMLERLVVQKRAAQYGTASEKAEAQKLITDLEKELDKVYRKAGAGLEGALKSHLPEDLAAEVHSVAPKYGMASGAAAAEAAKTGENKIFSLFHGENALAEKASKLGKPVKDLTFLQRLRPVKTAAVLGIAGVGIAYLAGVGRSQGEQASKVAGREQNQGQTAGLGV